MQKPITYKHAHILYISEKKKYERNNMQTQKSSSKINNIKIHKINILRDLCLHTKIADYAWILNKQKKHIPTKYFVIFGFHGIR